MRRMMLMAASWPSNSEAAVTKRTLFEGRYSAKALNSADKSVMGRLRGGNRMIDVYVNVNHTVPWVFVEQEFFTQCDNFSQGQRSPTVKTGVSP
jgi:hypothetical protein